MERRKAKKPRLIWTAESPRAFCSSQDYTETLIRNLWGSSIFSPKSSLYHFPAVFKTDISPGNLLISTPWYWPGHHQNGSSLFEFWSQTIHKQTRFSEARLLTRLSNSVGYMNIMARINSASSQCPIAKSWLAPISLITLIMCLKLHSILKYVYLQWKLFLISNFTKKQWEIWLVLQK